MGFVFHVFLSEYDNESRPCFQDQLLALINLLALRDVLFLNIHMSTFSWAVNLVALIGFCVSTVFSCESFMNLCGLGMSRYGVKT